MSLCGAPAALLLATSVAAAEPAYDHHVRLTPENSTIGNFPAQKAPILTIRSGDTVRIDTGGGGGWSRAGVDPDTWLKDNGIPVTTEHPAVAETAAVLEQTVRYAGIESGHLLIGPIAIEISGTAIETANTAVLQFILHKGRTLSAPRAETATHYIAIGLDPDLDNAMQMAADQTVEWLAELKGFDLFTTMPLASIGIDYEITQIVDGTKGVHAMIPKSYFVDAEGDY